MNYYPFHIGDYVSATRHLSWEEDAAFRRLLDTYYTTEKPIPADLRAACRLVMAQTDSQREAVRVVLDEFFALTDDGWINRRADAEIAAMREKQQKQRDKANKRWALPKAEPGNATASTNYATASTNDADAMPPTPTPTPTPTPEEKTGSGSPLRAAPPPPPFDGENVEILNGKSVVPLAPQWALPEQWGLDAEALGWKPVEVEREAEKFRQYWTAGRGNGTRRSVKGWRQSWSTWLEKAARDRR